MAILLLLTSCAPPHNSSQKSPSGQGEACKDLTQEACSTHNQCIFNTKISSCEDKISGQGCADYGKSAFQCEQAPIFGQELFGCLYRDNTCQAAASCADLTTAAQCGRAQQQNCAFENNTCIVKSNNFPVFTYLVHTDPETEKRFKEAFTAFGAFLLTYQGLAKTHNKAGIEQQLNQLFAVGLPGDGVQADGTRKWLGIAKNVDGIGDLVAINARLVNPVARAAWEAWIKNPGNFLSWIIYPVMGQEFAALNILSNQVFPQRAPGNLLMWSDDGLCMFSWIMELKLQTCPPQLPGRPNPNKWLVKYDNNAAVTVP